MSTWSGRDFRPRFHFTPPFGWINDPNGLCVVDGKYHLFAQYYPYDAVWGPMHWLHAVSDDLLAWRPLGVALRPDGLGQIFSGSAVWDAANSSGLGKERGPLVVMFTHHGAVEQQSVAWAEDGVHFRLYPGNPVIPNPGVRDFRDPKVFSNPVHGGWSAVVAAGDRVAFYASRDLLHWERTGEFGRAEGVEGVFECPDCFPVAAPDGSTVWVLSCSNMHPEEEGGPRTQYFLGAFDGDAFRRAVAFDGPALVDEGFDNYAAVTFSGAPQPIAMGWAASWVYARQLPTNEFCGQMTLARRASLRETKAGLRLAWEPVVPAVALAPARDGAILPGASFRLRLRADGPFEASLVSDAGEAFRFGLDGEGFFYTDRSHAGMSDFHPFFAAEPFARTRAVRVMEGPVCMDVFFDACVCELFADGGVYAGTTLVFPETPYARLRLEGVSSAELGPFA